MVSANDEYTQRLIVTVSLYYSFFTYGLEYAIVSPTMLLIRDQLCTDFENVSYAVLIRSFNFCLGSLAGKMMLTDGSVDNDLFITQVDGFSLRLTVDSAFLLVSLAVVSRSWRFLSPNLM